MTICIIPARSGSKRIKNKNIKLFKGKPIISYAIRFAKSTGLFKKIIVSTDSYKISKIAKRYGAEAPFVRPADISEDVASELVTEHALKWLKEYEDYIPDIVITLTPCTPFTEKEDLEKAIQLLIDNKNWDSVITVRKAIEYPQWVIDWDGDISNTGKTLLGNSFDGEYNVSQNLKKYYFPMGAFFINRVIPFMKKPSMYGEKWGCYELDGSLQVDIDEPEDLLQAEKILNRLSSR